MTLVVRDLHVDYLTDRGDLRAVRGVDLDLAPGDRLGLAGESGSGKSTVAAALLGLLPPHARARGSVRLDGDELLDADEDRWRTIRGRRVAIVPQGAMAGLHPSHRVHDQVAEVMIVHEGLDRASARRRALELLAEVGLDPRASRAHPHELSGGMRQRVALAAALAGDPEVLVADEPTVGLDTATADRFLELVVDAQRERGFALLFVSHDLPIVGRLSDRLAICYSGRIVEQGPTESVLDGARHPYAQGLLQAAPSLRGRSWAAIPGRVPDPTELPDGCTFASRCPHRRDECATTPPVVEVGAAHVAECVVADAGVVTSFPSVSPRRHATASAEPVVRARDVAVTFRSGWWRTRREVRALAGVDLDVHAGEVVGLVGPSGSGKSTLARSLFGLQTPGSGSLMVDGTEVVGLPRRRLNVLRHRLSLVHQDPYGSLHPTMSVQALVAEGCAIRGDSSAEQRAAACSALELVGLDPTEELLARRPTRLSGGQRQRVALARALAVDPVLMVLDEPMSMLDASVRAGIAQSVLDACERKDLAVVLITHDLAEAAAICDRIVVLDGGLVVEEGPAAELVSSPAHPTTRRLFELADPLAASDPLPASEPLTEVRP
ncbi:MAG: ABC transporter ATP-binding protein [Actinomycetota bacterium]